MPTEFSMALDPLTMIFEIRGAGFGQAGELIVDHEVVPTVAWLDTYIMGTWPFDTGFKDRRIEINPTKQ